MSMTREEAIEELERLLSHWDDLENEKRSFQWYSKDAVEVSITSLRPVSRERIEKVWRGEWELIGADKRGRGGLFFCTRCRGLYPVKNQFCPHCGAPMEDEAVQMVMERLEALHGEKESD